MLDINFGSTRDDDLQPRSLCGCIGQGLQKTWAAFSIATLIECIDDKDESVLGVTRKGADAIKEERAFQRLRSKFWVIAKVLCYNGSKRGEVYGEFMD